MTSNYSTFIFTLLLYIYLNIYLNLAKSNDNSWDSLILYQENLQSSSNWQCGDQCIPGNATKYTQCDYIKTCCNGTLGDGALVNYLTMQYCFFNTVQPLGASVLAILVFYAFIILGNVADDYFAPTMAELADFLGVSHELAGVTFVAFGNGAPDISSSVAAITQGGDTTKLGLGALLGAAVFDPIAVSGAIAVIVDNPQVARRPFLRDCFFLFIAASCVLYITSDHKVTIAESLGMVIIYIFYVGSVLLGEIYKKLRKKKRREAKKRRESSVKPPPPTITDKIMPVLGAFSNDSMKDLFRQKQPQKSINKMPSIPDTEQNADKPPLSRQVSNESFLSRQESAEIPYIQDLYHQLEEEDKQHHHQRKLSHHKQSIESDNIEDSDSSQSSFDDDISSESSDDDEDRVWWKALLIYILRGPTLMVEILCKVTIPLTDKNWNDWTAIISCFTGPIFIQFAFLPDTMTLLIHDIIPIVGIVGFCGFILAVFTYWRVRRKYGVYRENEELQESLMNGGGDMNGGDMDTEQSIPGSMTGSMTNTSLSQIGGGVNNIEDVNKSGLLHSSTSLLSSQVLNMSRGQSNNINNIGILKEVDENEDITKKEKKKKNKNKDKKESVDLHKQPVMKFFFLLLGFLTAVAWIEVVANELVNLLTTLGVISTIDLALLGLTVLAWGNSIGDMIADVSVSKRGYAKMGISAAIGGPTLNVLIGVGLGTTINTISASDGIDHMPDTSNIFVCCIAVMLGIAIYAVWTAITNWTLKKSFGYFCFIYYFGFIVLNVLVYENIISLPFGS